jgi:hypothetical protein
VLLEFGGDAVVAVDFVVPSAGLRVGMECADVGELSGEDVGVLGSGHEVVALLADVGVRAGVGARWREQ